MAKNINSKPFDKNTLEKLNIFQDSFIKWLPVFIHNPYIKEIYIFDFFAGSGKDSTGKLGSPLILLDSAKGKNKSYCSNTKKPIKFIFNELDSEKYIELNKNVNSFQNQCKESNNCSKCIYNFEIHKKDFQFIFQDNKIQNILNDKEIAKFIILDQYGFKEIHDDIFLSLTSYPLTDFIFFITSSFIKRFKEHESVKKYINTQKIDFEIASSEECHRIIANYFKELIPENMEYYVHNFTIRKESKKSNIYGLIFGSNHSLGMEKFLEVCWKEDKFAGEANFNIDNNFEEDTLFYNPNNFHKKENVEKVLRTKIMNGEITDNRTGLFFALKQGCRPSLFNDVLKDLEKKNRIIREGPVNYASTKIHTVNQYTIRVRNEKI